MLLLLLPRLPAAAAAPAAADLLFCRQALLLRCCCRLMLCKGVPCCKRFRFTYDTVTLESTLSVDVQLDHRAPEEGQQAAAVAAASKASATAVMSRKDSNQSVEVSNVSSPGDVPDFAATLRPTQINMSVTSSSDEISFAFDGRLVTVQGKGMKGGGKGGAPGGYGPLR